MESITIQKQEYENLINKIESLEHQTHFLKSQYLKSDIFKQNFCALMSEESLSENWLSAEDEKAFNGLENDEFLNSILIKK